VKIKEMPSRIVRGKDGRILTEVTGGKPPLQAIRRKKEGL
jgi:hypothetical protein